MFSLLNSPSRAQPGRNEPESCEWRQEFCRETRVPTPAGGGEPASGKSCAELRALVQRCAPSAARPSRARLGWARRLLACAAPRAVGAGCLGVQKTPGSGRRFVHSGQKAISKVFVNLAPVFRLQCGLTRIYPFRRTGVANWLSFLCS